MIQQEVTGTIQTKKIYTITTQTLPDQAIYHVIQHIGSHNDQLDAFWIGLQ